MIFTIIIQMILNLLTFIFGWFKLPPLPQPLQDSLNYITQFFTTPIQIFKNLLGNDFFKVVIILIVTYMLLSPLIHMSIWLYKRIRG